METFRPMVCCQKIPYYHFWFLRRNQFFRMQGILRALTLELSIAKTHWLILHMGNSAFVLSDYSKVFWYTSVHTHMLEGKSVKSQIFACSFATDKG